jgi:hypothetical protein
MAYDDSVLGFHEAEMLAAVLTRLASEQLTVPRLLALTQAVHAISGNRSVDSIGLNELAVELAQRDLADTPFNTVVGVLEAAAPIGADEDVLAHITLRDVKTILSS